jgi:hypothetical protein
MKKAKRTADTSVQCRQIFIVTEHEPIRLACNTGLANSPDSASANCAQDRETTRTAVLGYPHSERSHMRAMPQPRFDRLPLRPRGDLRRRG